MSKVAAIYRHPVKGLRPEALAQALLSVGKGVEGDRAFAFQFLDESVAPELRAVEATQAPWMSKFNLAMQHDWPDLARMVPTWKRDSKTLRLEVTGPGFGAGTCIEGAVESTGDRERLAEFVLNFLRHATPYEKARHPLASPMRLIGSSDLSRRYADGERGPVTLASVATFEDLGEKLGGFVDWRRFRLNLIVGGAAAWEELRWLGKRIRIGECLLEVSKPLGRCANIDVHPESGARDVSIYARLKPTYGHALTGVRAEVIRGGMVRMGDSWELVDASDSLDSSG